MAQAVHIGIGRAGDFDEGFGGFCLYETGTLAFDAVTEEACATPVASEGGTRPLFRESRFMDVNATATGATTVVGQGLDVFFPEVFVEAGIAVVFQAAEVVETDVPTPAVVGVVTSKDVEQRAHGSAEDVAGAGGEDFQAGTVRAETDDAAASVLELTAVRAGGFHEPEIPSSDVDPAVGAEFEAVGGVIGRALVEPEGDAGDKAFGVFGNAVAIAVEIDGDVWRVEDVEAVMIPDNATGGIDFLDEFLHLVGSAVTIMVAEAEDAPALGVAAEGTIAITGDIEGTVGRGGDINRIVGGLPGGEEGCFKTIRHRDVLEDLGFFFWGELDDLGGNVASLL